MSHTSHQRRSPVAWQRLTILHGSLRESGRAGRDGRPCESILYYSADDVNKFKYLIRMQFNSASEKSTDKKSAERNLDQKMSHLKDMEKYCTQLKCRRNTLIGHFGGDRVDCKKTCDYCFLPQEVEKALRSAKGVKDVRNQNWSGGGQKQSWDGQWDGPHDEISSYERNDGGNRGMMVGDLRVTGPLEVDPGEPESKPSNSGSGVCFAKASDILSKYEAMERKANQDGGFFGGSASASNAKRSSVNIPEHLIASLNAASTKATKNQPTEKKAPKAVSSQDYANNAVEIEKRLAEIKSEREARLKALLEKQGSGKSSGAPPPPPPALAFGLKKK